MPLPKFYNELYADKLFTFAEFKAKLSNGYSENYLRKRLNDLFNSGYLGKIKNGLYYIIPQGVKKEDSIIDKFLVAGKLSADYLIGYHSALELHGAAQSPAKAVYIISKKAFRPLNFHGTEYRYVDGRTDFGREAMPYEGREIFITDRERTLIDGILRLKYSGGLEEYFKSVEMFPSVDFNRILRYLEIYGKKILFAKMGFVLSYYARKWGLPDKIKSRTKSNLSSRIYYLTSKKDESRLNKEWNLMVPVRLANLSEER